MKDYKTAFQRYTPFAEFMRRHKFSKTKMNLGRHLGDIAIELIRTLENRLDYMKTTQEISKFNLEIFKEFIKENELEEKFNEFRHIKVMKHLTKPNELMESTHDTSTD